MLRGILVVSALLTHTLVYCQKDANLQVLPFEDFQPVLERNDDTTYVINFWATWCGPCIKELPYFEQIHQELKDDPVKVVLVSLDFKNQIESRLIPFIEENKLQSALIYLDAPNPNDWIDQVDPNWSGALPGTLIYRRDSRRFFERTFESYDDLITIVKTFYKT